MEFTWGRGGLTRTASEGEEAGLWVEGEDGSRKDFAK